MFRICGRRTRPIFAFTPSEQVYRQLALYWGTFPVRIDFTGDPDKTIESAEKFLRGKKLADRPVIAW